MKLSLKSVQPKRYQYYLRKINLSFFFAGLIFAMFSTVQSQAVEQTQLAESVSHNMPLSNEEYAPVEPEQKFEVPAPGIPIGREALKDIKNKAETGTPNAPTKAIPALKSSQVSNSKVLSGCSVNISNGYAPSDIHGAVGTSRLVVVTNTMIGIYNKSTCHKDSYQSLEDFFSGVATSGQILFDPRVLYDFSNKRFFVTAESMNSKNYDQYQYIAISQDETGMSWWLYRIMLSKGSSKWCKGAVKNFWDYPSAGYDKSNWYITANDFSSWTSATGAIISIDKSHTLSGLPAGIACHNSLASNIQPPIVMDSASSAYFLSPGSGGGSSITRYKFTPTGSSGSGTLSTTAPISILSWTAPPDAEQPNGEKLDTIDGRFQSASIQRGNYIWNVHTVKLNGLSGLAFYKFSTTGTTPLFYGPIRITDSSRSYLFNSSTAISPSGEAFITASYTSSTAHASMMMIQGSASEWKGWHVKATDSSSSQIENCNSTTRGSCRWGDYSSTQLDPSNMQNAWGFNQLVNGTSQFDWVTLARSVSGPSSTGFLPATYYLLK